MIVGLTGGIGTGKSTVGEIFKHLGVPVFNADIIARNITNTNKLIQKAIVERFDSSLLDKNNQIDRAKLRTQIFNNPEHKLWLEQLLHPLIEAEIVELAKNTFYPYCVVEIPLLIEANMQHIVDRILTVDCDEELQVQRALKRGVHTEPEIREFIANQITRKKRLDNSDDIVANTEDMPALIKRIQELDKLYLSLSS